MALTLHLLTNLPNLHGPQTWWQHGVLWSMSDPLPPAMCSAYKLGSLHSHPCECLYTTCLARLQDADRLYSHALSTSSTQQQPQYKVCAGLRLLCRSLYGSGFIGSGFIGSGFCVALYTAHGVCHVSPGPACAAATCANLVSKVSESATAPAGSLAKTVKAHLSLRALPALQL